MLRLNIKKEEEVKPDEAQPEEEEEKKSQRQEDDPEPQEDNDGSVVILEDLDHLREDNIRMKQQLVMMDGQMNRLRAQITAMSDSVKDSERALRDANTQLT